MQRVTASEAVAAIPDGATVIFPGGCAEPRDFYAAFSAGVDRFSHLTVCAGFSFGRYAYLERGLGTNFRFVTWQASARLRTLFAENDRRKLGFVPLRLADLHQPLRSMGRGAGQGNVQPAGAHRGRPQRLA